MDARVGGLSGRRWVGATALHATGARLRPPHPVCRAGSARASVVTPGAGTVSEPHRCDQAGRLGLLRQQRGDRRGRADAPSRGSRTASSSCGALPAAGRARRHRSRSSTTGVDRCSRATACRRRTPRSTAGTRPCWLTVCVVRVSRGAVGSEVTTVSGRSVLDDRAHPDAAGSTSTDAQPSSGTSSQWCSGPRLRELPCRSSAVRCRRGQASVPPASPGLARHADHPLPRVGQRADSPPTR